MKRDNSDEIDFSERRVLSQPRIGGDISMKTPKYFINHGYTVIKYWERRMGWA